MNRPSPAIEAEIAKILADRYTEQELMKVQDVLQDFADEMKERGYTVEQCNYLFDFLGDTINAM